MLTVGGGLRNILAKREGSREKFQFLTISTYSPPLIINEKVPKLAGYMAGLNPWGLNRPVLNAIRDLLWNQECNWFDIVEMYRMGLHCEEKLVPSLLCHRSQSNQCALLANM